MLSNVQPYLVCGFPFKSETTHGSYHIMALSVVSCSDLVPKQIKYLYFSFGNMYTTPPRADPCPLQLSLCLLALFRVP